LLAGAEKFAPVREVRIISSDESGFTVNLRLGTGAGKDPKNTIAALAEVPGLQHVQILD
jgi:hypothetical protein